MRAHETRILVPTHVVPRPAIVAVLFHAGDVVRHEVVAKVVALVDGAPELARRGVDSLADAVADAVSIDLQKLALGSELEHVGAMKTIGVRVGIVRVRSRANRDEHLRAIGSEDNIASPVAAAAELGEARKLRNNLLGFAGCNKVAGLVGNAND